MISKYIVYPWEENEYLLKVHLFGEDLSLEDPELQEALKRSRKRVVNTSGGKLVAGETKVEIDDTRREAIITITKIPALAKD